MPFDPQSRFVRVILAEKGLTVRLVMAAPGAENPDLAAHNPALTIPVLIDEPPTGGEVSISPEAAIADYLEEAYRNPTLMPATSASRAEVRRLCAWFHGKFEADVNTYLGRRKIDDKLLGRRADDPAVNKKAVDALRWHLDYISWLLEQRSWLAGDKRTLADIAGAAHLSVIDYLGAVPWADFPDVKEWYARMKSRPSFRPLLADRLEGAPPPAHYANPDF